MGDEFPQHQTEGENVAAEAEQLSDESLGLLMPSSEEQRKANRRLGLILGSIAIAFALGFVAKMVLFH